MKILNAYKQYAITPLLQQHQIRAASVGKFIIENWKEKKIINEQAIIETLLLHDMGNIIKFDLENSPHLLADELPRLDFWKQKQKEFIEKYGNDEHEATYIIGKELGVSEDVEYLLSQLKSVQKAMEGTDWNIKVCFYSDLRCGPYGILSVNERFDDLLKRYKGRNHPIADIERTEMNRKRTLKIEKQLQEQVSYDLESITDTDVAENIEKLKDYELNVVTNDS